MDFVFVSAGSVTVQPKGSVEVDTEVQEMIGPPGLKEVFGVAVAVVVMMGPPGLVEGRMFRGDLAQAVAVVVPETVRVVSHAWISC